MGHGDALMSLGNAWREYHARKDGRKIAIGDGRTVNPELLRLSYGLGSFLASPQEALRSDVVWMIDYAGHRPYIDYKAMLKKCGSLGINIAKQMDLVKNLGHYIYVDSFRAVPAPIVLTPEEEEHAEHLKAALGDFVVIEPYIKKGAPINKQWGVDRFEETALRLQKDVPVYQISIPSMPTIADLPRLDGGSFRGTLAILKAASLYVGPEGGLHHGAAAMGTKATVIFGGFIAPKTTGYDFHDNLTGGAEYACGRKYHLCPHCTSAMRNITVDAAVESARRLLECTT